MHQCLPHESPRPQSLPVDRFDLTDDPQGSGGRSGPTIERKSNSRNRIDVDTPPVPERPDGGLWVSKTIPERLAIAISNAGMKKAEFVRAMEARQVGGASRASFFCYMRGKRTPRLPFLEAAADILGVHKDWLTLGTEPPLGSPQKVRHVRSECWKRLLESDQLERRQVEGAVAEYLPFFRGLSPRVRDTVYDLFVRLESFNWSYRYCSIPTVEAAHDLDLAASLGRILGAALTELSLDRTWISGAKQEQYVVLMCGLLGLLLPEESDPSAEELSEIQDLFFRLEKARGNHLPPHLKILGTRHPHQARLEGNDD